MNSVKYVGKNEIIEKYAKHVLMGKIYKIKYGKIYIFIYWKLLETN